MIRCQNCGEKISNNSVFCANCGVKILHVDESDEDEFLEDFLIIELTEDFEEDE